VLRLLRLSLILSSFDDWGALSPKPGSPRAQKFTAGAAGTSAFFGLSATRAPLQFSDHKPWRQNSLRAKTTWERRKSSARGQAKIFRTGISGYPAAGGGVVSIDEILEALSSLDHSPRTPPGGKPARLKSTDRVAMAA
jgi:hypothetical protein